MMELQSQLWLLNKEFLFRSDVKVANGDDVTALNTHWLPTILIVIVWLFPFKRGFDIVLWAKVEKGQYGK